jgi:hypothetical protein
MGQWKLRVFYNSGVGFYVGWKRGYEITILLPFAGVVIGLSKHARGYKFFNIGDKE